MKKVNWIIGGIWTIYLPIAFFSHLDLVILSGVFLAGIWMETIWRDKSEGELEELQEAYDMAMEEINKLRKK